MGCMESAPCRRSLYKEYEVSKQLGAGVFATVYAAKQFKSGQDVAIKVLRTRGKSPALLQMAKQEVLILRRIQTGSEHCTRFVDAFDDSNAAVVCIVMEKCDTTLVMVLQGCDPTETLLWRLLRDMLTGIAFIHSIGITHRDVKIDNFLCSESFAKKRAVVKLCDFGFAAHFGRFSGMKLRGVFGTAPYMSPEMIEGEHDEKSDLWSLGVLMHVLLLGNFPYTAGEHSSKAMKAAITKGTPSPCFSSTDVLIPSPSESAVAFMSCLLTREPRARPTADDCFKFKFVHVGPGKDAGAQSLRHAFWQAGQIGAYTRPAGSEPPFQELSFFSKEGEILTYETVVDGTDNKTINSSKLRGCSPTESQFSTAGSLSETGATHGLAMDTLPTKPLKKVPERDDGSSLSLPSPVSSLDSLETRSRWPSVPPQSTSSVREESSSSRSDVLLPQRYVPGSVLTMDVLPTLELIHEETDSLPGNPTKSSL